ARHGDGWCSRYQQSARRSSEWMPPIKRSWPILGGSRFSETSSSTGAFTSYEARRGKGPSASASSGRTADLACPSPGEEKLRRFRRLPVEVRRFLVLYCNLGCHESSRLHMIRIETQVHDV